jgi:acetolactate synthase-1/2/3 large subunit
VLNNFGDGMVKQWQKLYYKGRLSASDKSLRRKDFIKAAQADGFEFARRLDSTDEMEDTIKAWLDYPGPAFLEVIIDREACVYPMVGPGLAYDSMITGEFIPNRNGVASEDDIDGSSMF